MGGEIFHGRDFTMLSIILHRTKDPSRHLKDMPRLREHGPDCPDEGFSGGFPPASSIKAAEEDVFMRMSFTLLGVEFKETRLRVLPS